MLTPKFQTEVHELAKSKGWWDTPREFGTLIALCHSEVSEAYDAYDGDPTTPEVVTELADVVIRVLDLCEYYHFVILEKLEDDIEFSSDKSFHEFLCELHTMLSGALEAARCNEPDEELAIRWLRNVVISITTYQPLCGLVESAAYAKHQRNKERAHKHGGKLF